MTVGAMTGFRGAGRLAAMPSPLRKQFGMNVCKLRNLRGLKQWELAVLLEIEPGYMCRIEAGLARITEELIMGICAALRCTWDALMEGIPRELAVWKTMRTPPRRRQEKVS